MLKVLLVAWGTLAVLLIGVRIGHDFGHKDAHEEMQNPRRRELREVARWIDPAIVRRRRILTAAVLLFVAVGAVLWTR